jgi:hypothetical protein
LQEEAEALRLADELEVQKVVEGFLEKLGEEHVPVSNRRTDG